MRANGSRILDSEGPAVQCARITALVIGDFQSPDSGKKFTLQQAEIALGAVGPLEGRRCRGDRGRGITIQNRVVEVVPVSTHLGEEFDSGTCSTN